jgi:hypothetical protein
MYLSTADTTLLNNGRKPISGSVSRRNLYLRARHEYEMSTRTVLQVTERPLERTTQDPCMRLSVPAGSPPDDNWFDDANDYTWAVVSGGAGVSAFKQSGLAAESGQRLVFAKGVLSSGGCLAWIPTLVGMLPAEVRNMNAGVPFARLLRKVQGIPRRERFAFGGKYEMTALRDWFHDWLRWAGTPTFGDVKFPDGHPLPLPGPYRDRNGNWRARLRDLYRISIGLTVWEPTTKFPLMTQAELDDPRVIHNLLKRISRHEYPLRKMRQRFFPNDVGDEFPWMNESIDATPIADVVHWSCCRWPFAVPKLLQDPESGRLKIVFDGASLHTHPDLWMAGFQPIWDTYDPLRILVSRGKRSDRRFLAQTYIDNAEKPWHMNFRTSPTGFSALELQALTVEECDAMFLAGVLEARSHLHQQLIEDANRYDERFFKANNSGRIRPRPPLHFGNIFLEDGSTTVTDQPRALGW